MAHDAAGIVVTALAVGVAVGLDNLRASAAVGLVTPPAHQRPLLLALILADVAALAVGSVAGSFVPNVLDDGATIIGILVLAALALAALAGIDEDRLESVMSRRGIVVGLPLVLSLDNLAAGAALVAVGYPLLPTIPIVAAVGVVLCLAGFAGGAAIRSWKRLPGRRLGGLLFSIAVVFSVLGLR